MRLDDPTGSILHQVRETYGAFVWVVAAVGAVVGWALGRGESGNEGIGLVVGAVVGAAVGVWLTAALS